MKIKKLNIWLLTDGETLPTVENAKRMRTWLLGDRLSSRGHNVVWWSSNFFHMKKKRVSKSSIDVPIRPNFVAKLLESGTYKTNISLRRVFHHYRLGKAFYKEASEKLPPDIIIVSLPILDLVKYAIKYGEKFNVPVIIDIRDMWPDIFQQFFKSQILKKTIKVVSKIISFELRNNLRKANAIVSMHKDLLSWGISKAALQFKNDMKTGVFYLGYDEFTEKTEIISVPSKLIQFQKKIIFSYIGIFGGSYDIESIVDVAEILQNEGDSTCHFVIAGDGPKRAALEKKVANLKNVTFLGWVDKVESRSILQYTNILIIPNQMIALPNKFFEGLFFGLPLLHCMDGEAREITERNNVGYYYNKDSMQELLQGIKLLSENPEILEKMKKNAQNLYKTTFRNSIIYDNYCKFIEEVEASVTR